MRIRKGRIYSIGIKDVKNNSLNIPEGYSEINQLYHGKAVLPRMLKNINLPQDVRVLNDKAFQNLFGLTGINLSNIVYIGSHAFYNTNLNSINLSNLESISYDAFEDCNNLKEIVIDKTIKETMLKAIKLG